MSDNEAEMSQTDSNWEAGSAFSSNGSEPREGAVATDTRPDADVDDRLKFLTDLTAVMQTTAASEKARNTELTESRRKTHIDSIRAREAMEAEELRELAKEDVKGIDAWSEGEIKRIKLERERRIASRREQLQIRLEEHRSVIAREVDGVEAAVAGYRTEMDDFFTKLGNQTDPVEFARQAGSQPAFPDLTKAGAPQPVAAAPDYGYVASAPAVEAVAEAPQASIAEAEPYVAPEAYVAPAETHVEPEAPSPEPEQTYEPQPEPEPVAEAQPVVDEVPAEPPVETQPEPVAEAEPVAQAEQTYESQPEPTHEQQPEPSYEPQPEPSYEQQPEPVAAQDETPMVGVMDPDAGTRPAEAPWDAGAQAGHQAEAPQAVPVGQAEAAAETAEAGAEPVAAEAQVVMPRSSGAGSWLRWPSSSVDRSDPNNR